MKNLKKHLLLLLVIFPQIALADINADLVSSSKAGDMKKTIELLSKNTVDINAQDDTGSTLLCYAASSGSLPLVTYILSQGADINIKTKSGGTALHLAALSGSLEVVKALVDKGADVNIKMSNGKTALAIAKDKDTKAYLKSKGAI